MVHSRRREILNERRWQMKTLLIGIIGLMTYSSCLTPDRKDPTPPKKKEVPIPQIAGPSNWGFIAQDVRKVTINGDRTWRAEQGVRSYSFSGFINQTGRPLPASMRSSWTVKSLVPGAGARMSPRMTTARSTG